MPVGLDPSAEHSWRICFCLDFASFLSLLPPSSPHQQVAKQDVSKAAHGATWTLLERPRSLCAMPDGAPPAPTVELHLLGTDAAPSPAEHHGFLEVPSARRGHRRSSLARLTELEHQLHRDKSHLAEEKLAKALALVLYTLARISANLVSIDYENHMRIVNALVRPLVTGLGVGMFLIREERFSTKSRLLIWSRRTVFVLAIFVFDESMSTLRAALPIFSVLPWEITCNVMQVHMTNLRLQALGWRLTAKFCHIMAAIGCGFLLGGSGNPNLSDLHQRIWQGKQSNCGACWCTSILSAFFQLLLLLDDTLHPVWGSVPGRKQSYGRRAS